MRFILGDDVTAQGFDLVTGGVYWEPLDDRLLEQGRTVRVLDSFAVGGRTNLKLYKVNPRLEIVEGDVGGPNNLPLSDKSFDKTKR